MKRFALLAAFSVAVIVLFWAAPAQPALASELTQESCPTFKDGYWVDVCRGTWWKPGGVHQYGYPPSMMPQQASAKPKAPACPGTEREATMVVSSPGVWYWDCATLPTPAPQPVYVVQPRSGQTWGGYHPDAVGAVRPQKFYVVQPGDTVSGIAWMSGTTVSYIVRANNLADANYIYAGQVLVVP